MGRPGAHAKAVAEPAGGGGGRGLLVGAGRPEGVDAGQFFEPLAFQAIHQPPQPLGPLDPDAARQPVQGLGGELVDHGGQLGQVLRQLWRLRPLRPFHRLRRLQPLRPLQPFHRLRRLGRMCVRVHGPNLSTPPPTQTPTRKCGQPIPPGPGTLDVPPCQARAWRPTCVPGECMGPQPTTPVPGLSVRVSVMLCVSRH